MHCGLTGCRWRVEGDLGAVWAKHGVPAASHPEGVQAVGVQVAHNGAGSKHPVRGPPQPAVLAVLLGRGLAQPEVRGQSTVITLYPSLLVKRAVSLQLWHPPAVLQDVVVGWQVVFGQPPAD